MGSGGEAEGGSWPAGCGEPPPPGVCCDQFVLKRAVVCSAGEVGGRNAR